MTRGREYVLKTHLELDAEDRGELVDPKPLARDVGCVATLGAGVLARRKLFGAREPVADNQA